MAEIDNLSISISASTQDAIANLDRLASSLSRFRGAANTAAQGASGASNAVRDMGMASAASAERVGEAANSVTNFAQRLKAATAPLRAFGVQLGTTVAQGAGKAVSAVTGLISGMARIAKFRIYRSIIKDLGQSFKDLYGYSDAFGIRYAASVDKIVTAFTYLRNSIAAMVAPLVNMLAPVLDTIIDKVVEALNWVNQLFAAIGGQKTYTVAKKIAIDYGDTLTSTTKQVKKDAEEIKKTILGFDEINKLQKDTQRTPSSSTGTSPYSDNYKLMFEERPIDSSIKTIGDKVREFGQKVNELTKNWPDWLKWLLGIGAVATAAWGIKQLPKLLGNILKQLGKLFTVKVPEWFRWLFGPKGSGTPSVDIPGKITLPDADVTTNIKKGDWTALDDLGGTPVYLSPKLDNKPEVLLNNYADDWNSIPNRVLYFTPKFNNTPKVLYDEFKRGWDTTGSKTLYFTPKFNNTPNVLLDEFKREWNDSESNVLYFTPKLDNKASVIANLFKDEWNKAIKAVYVFVALKKKGWKYIRTWLGLDDPITANINLRKWGWENIRTWIGLDNPITANINLRKWGWNNIRTWIGLDNPVIANISLRKWGWNQIRTWIGLDTPVIADISLRKWGWGTVRTWMGLNNPVTANINLRKWGWSSLSDWIGHSVTVYVNLAWGNGGSFRNGGIVSFGGATGGGGKTSGGGAGRRRANGGIFNNGIWRNIPQYAGGTSSAHGTLFLAGEAGPEIVGHVGGRTEVLNKSQLAATMFDAVRSAMSGVTLDANFYNSQSGIDGDGMNTLVDLVNMGYEATERQNELLRQQNEYLRQLNAKDFTTEVTTSNLTQALNRANRRAGTTIVPVGT